MTTSDAPTAVQQYVRDLATAAKQAARQLAHATPAQKNAALTAMAAQIRQQAAFIAQENQRDVDAAQAAGHDAAFIDRLALTPARIEAMAVGLEAVAQLPDPVGQMRDLHFRPSGIQVGKMRVPLGVIGIIYESRPNVTAEAASLCLKAGNSCLLRGGSEAIFSNQAIAHCVKAGLEQAGLPAAAVQVLEMADRAAVGEMLQLSEFIDVIVPRGGKGLIARVSAESKIPVIKHLDGICHIYIDEDCDYGKAIEVAFNAKCQRYGTCNTLETLLIHRLVAPAILPKLCERYLAAGVELRGCDVARAIVPMNVATDADWDTEYLAPILSIRVVENLDVALDHIATHGSHHTDSIVTDDYNKAWRFLREVDSSSVMVNASTRFADGFEYGLGAEIGISTDKLHARGPVGLEGLTTEKFIVLGDGHIRQ